AAAGMGACTPAPGRCAEVSLVATSAATPMKSENTKARMTSPLPGPAPGDPGCHVNAKCGYRSQPDFTYAGRTTTITIGHTGRSTGRPRMNGSWQKRGRQRHRRPEKLQLATPTRTPTTAVTTSARDRRIAAIESDQRATADSLLVPRVHTLHGCVLEISL